MSSCLLYPPKAKYIWLRLSVAKSVTSSKGCQQISICLALFSYLYQDRMIFNDMVASLSCTCPFLEYPLISWCWKSSWSIDKWYLQSWKSFVPPWHCCCCCLESTWIFGWFSIQKSHYRNAKFSTFKTPKPKKKQRIDFASAAALRLSIKLTRIVLDEMEDRSSPFGEWFFRPYSF
jgi:hypothetical protein